MEWIELSSSEMAKVAAGKIVKSASLQEEEDLVVPIGLSLVAQQPVTNTRFIEHPLRTPTESTP